MIYRAISKSFPYKMLLKFLYKVLGRSALFCIYSGILFLSLGCEFTHSVLDHVFHWGEKDRRQRQKNLKEIDLQKWQRQLKLSRGQVIDLQEEIAEMLTEEQLEGELSRKIASAYLEKGRYDLASLHYKGALQNKLPRKGSPQTSSFLAFEKSLEYFDRALLLNSANPDLFYEAGLAYANASRSQGWEQRRFQIAVLLFERMAALAPQDIRPFYQLALLYGKIPLKNYRDKKYAIRLLKKILLIRENDVRTRFALAHFLVEQKQLSQAVQEYEHIERILEDMYRKEIIQGQLSSHPSYRRAKENREKLQECMQKQEACYF